MSEPSTLAKTVGVMELELGRLDLRYESLRARNAQRERRLLASIAASGQQSPIVVVRDGASDVVVDGYKRVRTLRRLAHDTVRATAWDLAEVDALVIERILRAGEHGSAIEEGWFLRELESRFRLSREELARRFDRTPSWVSRRLALVSELPASVQAHVRAGAIGAHAAMRYLVRLARANEADCERIANALAPKSVSSRQLGELYATYVAGNRATRELVVTDPLLVLRARAETRREGDADKTPVEHLENDLRIVVAVARRATARVRRGAIDGASAAERERIAGACAEVRAEVEVLGKRCSKELGHAG